MADADSITRIPDLKDVGDFLAEVDGTSPDTHGEHEANPEPPISQDNTPAGVAVHDIIDPTVTQEDVQPSEKSSNAVPASMSEVSKKLNSKAAVTAGKDKLVISAKAKGIPTKSGPPTPTVKKVLNSGAFGSGVTKAPLGSKAPATTSTLSKTTTPTHSTLRKSISTSSTNPPVNTASAMASSRSPPPQSRRGSMIPPRAPSATGSPPTPKPRGTLLSSLMSSKPASTEANTGAQSVARPRASISDAVRRTPSSSSMKGAPSNATPPPRPTRKLSSISSIQETRDDGKPLEEMQQKLKEAVDALSEKAEAVAKLEAALDSMTAAAEASQTSLAEVQQAKDAAELELQTLNTTLQRVRDEDSRDRALLEQELHEARLVSATQTETVRNLESKIESLMAEVETAHDDIEALRISSEQSSSASAAAAQAEREALLRARADFESISAEAEALKASHASTLQDLQARLGEAQSKATHADALEAQVKELKAEREENAAKLSELEVDILEMSESQEQAEEERDKVLERLESLKEELFNASAATQSALDALNIKEAQHAQEIAVIKEAHNEELQAYKDELSKVVADHQGLQQELAAAHEQHEQTKLEAQNAAEEHERLLEETEGEFLSKHLELSEEVKRLTVELEGQEAQYNSRVDAVKAEHELRLQAAFENAKDEAGEQHGEDLAALRAESEAAIEQLRAAHQSTVDVLKADYEQVLASQVGELEKKLSSQSLELRATQDDLVKAKAALDSTRIETESLKAQLEDARAAFVAASASPDQASEIDRLTKDLASLRDENVMLNDVLAVTKDSLSEMSSNHTKELEEAARIRVEEVIKLRATHEEDIGLLASQKSELSLRLSDMEGEIATLRAQAAAAPRSSGAGPSSLTTVSREELQKVHEAHNMKMHDLVAEHERTVRGLRDEIEGLHGKLDELHQDVTRKSMEVKYLEQEQEESQDSIIRLQADLERLSGTSNA